MHKPLLAVPLQGQFEQVFNARYLAHLGYGAHVDCVDEESLGDFLAHTADDEQALASYTHDANAALLGKLDELLDMAAAGLF